MTEEGSWLGMAPLSPGRDSPAGARTSADALTRAGLRDWVHVLVGGAPVTAEFAERVGADGYAPDAKSAVRLTRRQVEGASADLSGWRRKEPLHG
jgi:hypothetical protein